MCRSKAKCTWNVKTPTETVPVFLLKIEGRSGVFSWCVISSFYFPWNANLGNYSSWLVTWRFSVTREEPKSLTDIRDFTTQFYVILRRKFSEWLEWSSERDLRLVYIWSQTIADRESQIAKSSAIVCDHMETHFCDRLRSFAIDCDCAIIWKPKFCDLRSKGIP